MSSNLANTLAAIVCSVMAMNCYALPRDKTERDRFVREHPCPANGNTKGACPGYQVDHKKALMNGGADHPSNMEWTRSDEHKKKTKSDIHECKKAKSCLHRGLKK